MPTRLILIRHGQTEWNLKKRYVSFTDIDLDTKGRDEAKCLRQKLSNEKIYKVYVSDSKRAINFAKIAFRGFIIEKISDFREMNFGIFEGMTYREIMKKYPKIYNRWLNNPFNTVIPKAESLSNFKKRILKIFKKIVSVNRNRTLAIVTHAGPIRIIINDILKSRNIWDITPDLASINIIEFKRGKANITLLNDTDYLNG
jgi:broad specificity phosphatase PhoE